MRFGAIANSARGGPQRPPPMGDRVKFCTHLISFPFVQKYSFLEKDNCNASPVPSC